MDEEKLETLPEETPVETAENIVEDLPAETAEEAQEDKPKKSLKGLIEYIKTHENLRQLVLFTLFSMICGVTQFTITLVLPIILKATITSMSDPFGWIKMGDAYFFDFTDKGQGMGSFLGWLLGSIWGQALTFILNRKKTFNAPDHLVFRAIAYTVMAILIIIVQTAIGKLEGVFKANDPNASDFVNVIYNLLAQVVAGMAAFTMSFLGNKFIIMRKFKNKNEVATTEVAEEAAAEEEAK